MNKYQYLLVSLFVVPLLSVGQTYTHVISFDESDFNFETQNSYTTIYSDSLPFFFEGDTLLPGLPIIRVEIPVGHNQELCDFSEEHLERTILSDVIVAPSPKAVCTSAPSSSSGTVTANYTQTTYPDAFVKHVDTYEKYGQKYIAFNVCPFKYDTRQRNLSLMYRIELIYHLNVEANVRSENQRSESDNWQYLIVTNNSLKSAFAPLAAWKTRKGVRGKVITTEEIGGSYNGMDLKQKIKNALKDYYDNHSLKYVLLGGDSTIIPIKRQYCPCDVVTDSVYNYIPTDLFYSCFGTMDWTNVSHCDINYSLDVAISRIPVNSPSDVSSFVNNILEYEMNPDTMSWNKSILLSGIKTDTIINGISDSHNKCELLYANYITPNWDGNRFRFYDTGTDHPQGADYNVTWYTLQTEYNQGYTFLHMKTHGNSFYWRLEDVNGSPNFYFDTLVPFLNNHSYTTITTASCLTNDFSKSDCLSKAFMVNPNAKAVAYLGHTGEALDYRSFNILGPTEEFIGHFYSNLFSDSNHRLGNAVEASGIDLRSNISSTDSDNKWARTLLGMNLVGDPETPVYINKPKTFSNVSINYRNGLLFINSGTIGCKVCIMSKNDNGSSLYSVIHIPIGNTAIPAMVDECEICITKPGYIPYTTSLVNKTYIQNQVYTEDATIISGETYIGRDVTTSTTEGSVLVQSGTLTINSPKKVYIKNSFKVESGAKLRINP